MLVCVCVQRVTVTKRNGSLGMSIVGGRGQTSHPFGINKPGIFISKVIITNGLYLFNNNNDDDDVRQAISLGRYGARYIGRLSRGEHSQRSGSSSQPCSDQQEHQVQPAIQHTCVRSGGH